MISLFEIEIIVFIMTDYSLDVISLFEIELIVFIMTECSPHVCQIARLLNCNGINC